MMYVYLHLYVKCIINYILIQCHKIYSFLFESKNILKGFYRINSVRQMTDNWNSKRRQQNSYIHIIWWNRSDEISLYNTYYYFYYYIIINYNQLEALLQSWNYEINFRLYNNIIICCSSLLWRMAYNYANCLFSVKTFKLNIMTYSSYHRMQCEWEAERWRGGGRWSCGSKKIGGLINPPAF